jgi:type III pantothenate kinase
MMFLAIDIGNTSTTFGLFKKEERFEMTFRFPTASIIEGENIEQELLPKLVALGDLDSVIISSVVPNATSRLREILNRTHKDATIKTLTNSDVPIVNKYRDPLQVGTDRLLCSLAAYQQYGIPAGKPLIVIGLGTATTFDCVNESGEYLGGIISLGVGSSAKYLSNIAAQLPEIELVFPEHVLGQSTTEAMQSGILYGAIAMIEGLIDRLRKEVFENKETIVIATGGLSKLFEGETPVINYFMPHLVLEGIAIIANSK